MTTKDELAQELGALTGCMDMLTARIAKLESWRTGAQVNIDAHAASIDRQRHRTDRLSERHDTLTQSVGRLTERVQAHSSVHQRHVALEVAAETTVEGHTLSDYLKGVSNRLAKIEAKVIYGAVPTPVYTVVPTHSEVVAKALLDFRAALSRLEEDQRAARQIDTETVNAHERRLIKLEESPVDKRWAAGVMARLDRLEAAKTDHAIGISGLMARLDRLDDPGSTMPEALRLAVQYPLTYELWRSGLSPEWDKGTSRDAKLMYSLIVAREDYVGFPPNFGYLKGYPNGYHWLIKDAKGRIAAVHVNAHMPQPPTYYPQEVQP